MAKRKERRELTSLSPPSPPSTTTPLSSRPTTPTSPVQIPKTANRDTAHRQKRQTGHRRRPCRQEHHDPNSVSPSMAALLAVTDIPRQHQRRRRRGDKPLTLEDVIDDQQVSEKELSWNLSRSPMDMLLSPPEETCDDDVSVTDSNIGSVLSTETISVESVPSLGDSFATDGVSSIETPGSINYSVQRRRLGSGRRSLEPLRSPINAALAHPLERPPTPDDSDTDPLDTAPLKLDDSDELGAAQLLVPFKPLKMAFKSNLTASLRALRSAAKSFSSLNFSSIPSDDFLTRSLLSVDPNVPYMDERRPPVIEELPSAELRRYLNPTSSSRLESQQSAPTPPGPLPASIQMQTYKVHRSRSAPPSSRTPRPSLASQPPQTTSKRSRSEPQLPSQTALSCAAGMRQREMRENSDFIRIAVMEMVMRKRGKLDDQRPGRARWALPPRKLSTKPYQIGPNGVPARWTATSC